MAACFILLEHAQYALAILRAGSSPVVEKLV